MTPLGWFRGRVYGRPAMPRRWTLAVYSASIITATSWLGPRRWPL